MITDVKTLVICSKDGKPIDVRQINQKGYSKSIEQGTLWCLHQETDRLLPFDENQKLASLENKGYWFLATMAGSEAAKGKSTANLSETAPESIPESDCEVLPNLWQTIIQRKKDMPEGSYTTHLFSAGPDKIRKKAGEEAVELILAREPGEIIYEAADFIYHLFVLLAALNLTWDEVLTELARR